MPEARSPARNRPQEGCCTYTGGMAVAVVSDRVNDLKADEIRLIASMPVSFLDLQLTSNS
jgi:hypothetical protein